MNFLNYRFAQSKKNRYCLNFIYKLSIGLCFLLEIIIYLLFIKFKQIEPPDLHYVLSKIILPTSINILSTLTLLFLNSRTENDDRKNFLTALNGLIICFTIAFFHVFFDFLLILLMVPTLLCSVFGDIRILKKIAWGSIAGFIICTPALFINVPSEIFVYKFIAVMIIAGINLLCIAISKTMIKLQVDQVSFIVASFKDQEKLIEDMRIEPLTKLSNRIAMNECAANMFSRFYSKKIQPFMVLFDIDFFKKINDTYGHLCGDVVLVRLAEILMKKMNGNRNAFRFGGEEFVLLFDYKNQEEVYNLVEEIRSEFSQSDFTFAGNQHFTLSAGIAPLLKDWTLQKWFEAADSAMYKAKKDGRNQTVIF